MSASASPSDPELGEFFRRSPEPLCTATLDGVLRCANPAMAGVLGSRSEDLEGTTVADRAHPEDRSVLRTMFARLKAGEDVAPPTMRMRHADGTYHWFEWDVLVCKRGIVYAAVRDVTERVQTADRLERQAALREEVADLSLQFIRTPIDKMDALIDEALAQVASELGVDYARVFLLDAARMTLRNTHEWAASDVPSLKDELQAVPRAERAWSLNRLEQGERVVVEDFENLPASAERVKEGARRQGIRACVTAPLVRDDHLIGYVDFCMADAPRTWTEHEITLLHMMANVFSSALQRRATEQRLRAIYEELELISQAVESASDAITIADVEGHFQYVNPAFKAIFGLTVEDLNAVDDPRQPRLYVNEEKGRAILKQLRDGTPWQGTIQMRTQDGTVRDVAVRSSPVRDAEGNVTHLVSIHTDITEWRRAEEALRASEKLAATGRMAASIAHEINNPLAGIKNAFQLIKPGVPDDFEHAGYIPRIEQEIERIRRIVRQMYALYSPEREAPSRVHLPRVIEDVVQVLQSTAREKQVTLTTETAAAPAEVWLSEGDLQQVLYNLVDNAIAAAASGGHVRIAVTPNVEIDDRAGAEALAIRVEDDGPGISEAIQDRIFEPFFTQHPESEPERMGLGLSIAQSLVEAWGGVLCFHTEPGHGTVFEVQLPCHGPPAE